MATIYSHSRLSSFENCRRQFYFRYVLKLPAESEGVEAFVGKRVHEILERLHEFADRGQLPSVDKVVQRYQALFDETYDEERIRIVKTGLTRDFYRELGERCLRTYYHRNYPFDVGETIGLERRVVFDLESNHASGSSGRYKMQGIIDRITRLPDGTVEIIDYKTGQWVPGQKKLDQDRQLALYQLGLSEEMEELADAEFVLVWHYVARGQVRTSRRSPEQLTALRQDTIDVIDAIRREQEFAPKKIKLCDWCEYKAICPEWNAELAEPEGARTPTPPPVGDRHGQLSLL